MILETAIKARIAGAFLGEGLPMLWLLMIGVNVRVWNGRAHAA